MARTPFQVEILSPEGEVFNDEVEMLSTRTAVGSIGVLANHQPLLALLEPTELRLHRSDSDVVSFAQGEGYLQVQQGGERVLVLVDEVYKPGEVDISEMKSKLERAQGEFDRAQDGSHEQQVAKRDVHRYQMFVNLCERGANS